MNQAQDNVAQNQVTSFEQCSIKDEVIAGAEGELVNMAESAVQQSLREMESVWMKHHNHYAEVLDSLMLTVKAARGVV